MMTKTEWFDEMIAGLTRSGWPQHVARGAATHVLEHGSTTETNVVAYYTTAHTFEHMPLSEFPEFVRLRGEPESQAKLPPVPSH